MKWLISSGELHAVVEAETLDEAVRKAVQAEEPHRLGALLEVTQIASEPVYTDTEAALKRLGLWGQGWGRNRSE